MAFEDSDYKRAKTANSGKFLRNIIIILVMISFALIVSYSYGLLMEYIQIKEIGQRYTSVFWTNIKVRLISQMLSFLIIFIVFSINSLIIRKHTLKDNFDLAIIRRISPMLLITFIVSFLVSRFISENVYSLFLTFVNSSAFGRIDPVFNQDIGYYIFQRPFLISLMESVRMVLLVQVIYTVVAYLVLQFRSGIENIGDITKDKSIIIHIIIDLMLLFVAISLQYKFAAEEVLYGDINGLIGAGFTDVRVWIPYNRISPYALIVIIAFFIYYILKRKLKFVFISILSFPALWILTAIIAFFVDTLVVAPNEIDIEAPNISNNIYMTREAYGLDKIVESEFPIKNTLMPQDIEENMSTLENIRITDYNATLNAKNKLQGIRPYYSFNDTDIVSYTINGKSVPVYISAREIDKEKLSRDIAGNYINRMFKYTHGYGVVASPTNVTTNEGQPEFIVKGIPVTVNDGVSQITQPRIYFGELTSDHVVVNAKIKELDYSNGQETAEFSYDGRAGVKLNFINRLLFALHYGDYKILVSSQITDNSKILTNRNIIERVKMIAPVFEYDTDPYILITEDGRLKWVIDAYSTSKYYPYSQRSGEFNYIRNSVKVIVDAYDGTVEFYITDHNDPIVQTYKKIYPELFMDRPIPGDIAKHLRYPERLFKIQAELYKKYHVTDVSDFYNQSDVWDLAKEKYRTTEAQYIEPYYNMMSIKGLDNKGESLLLTIPFTPNKKDYINSWLAVGSDGKYYGKMILYKFKDAEKNTYGTLQIENRVDNDPKISSEMALWNQGGSSVIRGNMIVVPIKDSLLYVEPVYITTKNAASFAELKRVIIAYKETIVMEATLKEAIDKVLQLQGEENSAFIEAPIKPTQDPMPSIAPETIGPRADELTIILNQLVDLYNSYKQYNSEGDFENAGIVMANIDKLIAKAEELLNNEADMQTEEDKQVDEGIEKDINSESESQ